MSGSEQTHNTLPQEGANFFPELTDFLKQEDAKRYADMFQSFVVSGGIHGTVAGLTGTPDPCLAYPGGYYTTETASITYPNNSTCWVAIHKDSTGAVAGFSRVGSTNYLLNTASATQPTLPANAAWLMCVTTSGGSIVAVLDLRVRSPLPLGVIADAYATLSDAIAACPSGGHVYLSSREYAMTSLVNSKPITLVGSGWQTTTLGLFGDANWTDPTKNTGTILRISATSGIGLDLSSAAANNAYNLRDLAIIGPGTGTSTGVQLGQTGVAAVMGQWSNVLIANFSIGLDGVWEDYGFHEVRFRGNLTNLIIESDTNQNVYYNCEFQRATTSLRGVGGLVNAFYGGLIQGNTTGILFDTTGIGGDALIFDGLYFEGNSTDNIKFDATSASWTNVAFRNTRIADGNGPSFVGSTTINYLQFISNQWAGISVTLPSNVLNAVWLGNNVASFTDNGKNTAHLQTVRGSATFATAATKVVLFDNAVDDTTYKVVLGGQANETFWVTGKSTTGFTLNSSNASSVAIVDWYVIR